VFFIRAAVDGAMAWMGYLNVQISGLQKSLSRIEGTLKISSAIETLEKAVRADAKDAPSTLKAARAVIKTASSEKIPIDPTLAIKVAERAIALADNEIQPALRMIAWETVQDAANYASLNSNPEAIKLLSASLPDCIAGNGPKGGVGGLYDTNVSDNKLTVSPKTYFHDCVLVLDKPDLSKPSFGFLGPVTFERCIIKYNGGVPMLVGSFIFKDCALVLNFNQPPPPPGHRFAETLIASGLKRAEIPKGST
jgi:hypothetical protein